MPSYENAYLILDAQRLLLQYERRNDPHWALDVDERKRWAAEMEGLLKQMIAAVEATKPWGSTPSERHGEWEMQRRSGMRGITEKGWCVRHPGEWDRICREKAIRHTKQMLANKTMRHQNESLRRHLAALEAEHAADLAKTASRA